MWLFLMLNTILLCTMRQTGELRVFAVKYNDCAGHIARRCLTTTVRSFLETEQNLILHNIMCQQAQSLFVIREMCRWVIFDIN